MANELQPLSVLFQNRLFRIPDYQRGYAWKHGQLADFWDDLMNLHEDKYHYTGLLSLKVVNPKDNAEGEWLPSGQEINPHCLHHHESLEKVVSSRLSPF